MASVKLLSWHPQTSDAWYELNGDRLNRKMCLGITSAEAAEAKRLEILAEEEQKEANREARRQERQRLIDAEAVARAVAKAAATPHFAGSLTFLKLIQYKATCPYFDEIKAEIDRLQAEADAEEQDIPEV